LQQHCDNATCEEGVEEERAANEKTGVHLDHHGLRLVQSNPDSGQILASDYVLPMRRAAGPLSVPQDVRYLKFPGAPLLIDNRDVPVIAVKVPIELEGTGKPQEVFICVELEEIDQTAPLVTDVKIRPGKKKLSNGDDDEAVEVPAPFRLGQCTVESSFSTDDDADKLVGIIWLRHPRR
jgi:hypothetical protein